MKKVHGIKVVKNHSAQFSCPKHFCLGTNRDAYVNGGSLPIGHEVCWRPVLITTARVPRMSPFKSPVMIETAIMFNLCYIHITNSLYIRSVRSSFVCGLFVLFVVNDTHNMSTNQLFKIIVFKKSLILSPPPIYSPVLKFWFLRLGCFFRSLSRSY